MSTEFTTAERKQAKQAYKNDLKFNNASMQKDRNRLVSHAIDTKSKSNVGFNVGYSSKLIILN